MGKLGIKTDERECVGRGQQESGPLGGFRAPELLKSRPGLRVSPTFWSTRSPSSYWRQQDGTLFRVICSHWSWMRGWEGALGFPQPFSGNPEFCETCGVFFFSIFIYYFAVLSLS